MKQLKRVLASIVSISILATMLSAFPITAGAVKATVFSDDFTGENCALTQSAGELGDNWLAVTDYTYSPCSYVIEEERLYLNYGWNMKPIIAEPIVDWDSVSANNTISFSMAMTGGSKEASNRKNGNASWTGYSTIFNRFAVSEDGNSYYEIGKTGNDTACTNYPLPISVENGTSTGTANYTYRFYFAKVVNGSVVDIVWENDADGPFNKAATFGDGTTKNGTLVQ